MTMGTWSSSGGPYLTAMIANKTTATVSSITPQGQQIYMAFRLQPFNQTSKVLYVQSTEIQFGLRQCIEFNCASNGKIAWKLANGIPTTKTNQFIPQFTIDQPNTMAKYCYDSLMLLVGAAACATNATNTAIPYTSFAQPFHFDQVHEFVINAKFNPTTKTSWIAFNIDGQAYENMTQAACQCIDGSGSYNNLYPFIEIVTTQTTPNFGVATFIDYIGVWDYIPPSLPAGQLIFGIGANNPGGFNSAGFQGTPSFDNVFQDAAFELGGGQPAFGGVLVTIIVFAFLIMTTAMAWRGIPPGFIMDVEGIGVIVMMTALGILPIWITVASFILIGAVTFKILPGDIKT